MNYPMEPKIPQPDSRKNEQVLQPTAQQREMLENYERLASNYFHRKPETIVDAKWLDAMLEHIEPSDTLLELGSGTGVIADYVESKGFHVERSDAVDAFVEHQKEKGKVAYTLDLFQDALEKDKYKAIFAASVFHHLTKEQFPVVLKRLHTALQDAGYLSFRQKKGTGEEFVQSMEGVPAYYQYYTAQELQKILQDCGFAIEHVFDHEPKHVSIIAKKI